MKLLLLDRPVDEKIVKEREVEFFGPWAQPINSPEDLSKPTFEPYPNPESIYRVSLEAMNIAGDIFESLTKIFPDLTGVNKGKHFWEIFLGHYVILLAGIVEDTKVRHLSLPEKDYTLGLPSSDYQKEYTPYSWNDAQNYLLHDNCFKWYVMGLYLKNYYRNHEFIEYSKVSPRRIVKRAEELCVKILQGDYRRLFRKVASRLFGHLKLRNEMRWLDETRSFSLVWDSYQLEDVDFRKMKAVLLPERYLPGLNSLPSFQVDNKKRQRLRDFLPSPYGELLSLSLPIIALEGLSYLVRLAEEKLDKFRKLRCIYTHGQGFTKEAVERVFLALLADEGKKVVSVQHGGGTTYFAHSGRFMDRILADEHISWGPGYCDSMILANMNKTEALPSIYLSKLEQKSSVANEKKKWNVLFVVLEENRYIKWLYSPLFPDMAYDYFRRQKVLFDYFCTKKRTAVKLYPVAHGWGQANWIKSKYPRVKLLTAGRFVDYTLKSGIVITDYNSTAFLEMLAMGRPFLATWNRRWFKGTKLFEEFIDKLVDAGIFYEQPEALIKSYNEVISQDLEQWWNEDKRQSVLEEMANNFAMTSDIVYEEWAKEFVKNELHRE